MSQEKLTIDRATRTTREKEARRKPWAPPSRLDAPPAPEGFQHRWIRAEINGFSDKQHVYGRMREGYELVRDEELPEEYRNTLPTIEEVSMLALLVLAVCCLLVFLMKLWPNAMLTTTARHRIRFIQ